MFLAWSKGILIPRLFLFRTAESRARCLLDAGRARTFQGLKVLTASNAILPCGRAILFLTVISIFC